MDAILAGAGGGGGLYLAFRFAYAAVYVVRLLGQNPLLALLFVLVFLLVAALSRR